MSETSQITGGGHADRVPTTDPTSADLVRHRTEVGHLVRWLEAQRPEGNPIALQVLLAIANVWMDQTPNGVGVPFKAYRDQIWGDQTEPVSALRKRIDWADIERWWDDRKSEYIAGIPEGLSALKPFETEGRRRFYGWCADDRTPNPSIRHLHQSTATYNRELVDAADVLWLFRFILLDGGVEVQTWRGVLVRAPFVIGVVLTTVSVAVIIATALLSPAALATRAAVYAVVLVPLIWLWYVLPFMKLVAHRVRLLGDGNLWLKLTAEPAQIELIRDDDGNMRRIDLVRYTAPCVICGSTIRLASGMKDHRRHIVGRCRESPDEHVFSFDRWSREGEALRSRPAKTQV